MGVAPGGWMGQSTKGAISSRGEGPRVRESDYHVAGVRCQVYSALEVALQFAEVEYVYALQHRRGLTDLLSLVF